MKRDRKEPTTGRGRAAHASLATIGSTPLEVTDMPRSWSDKRERQYEHIKESYEERGAGEDKAEEIAARTVNKQRAEDGETKSSKKS